MTQKELEKYLWGAATQLRGTIDAGEREVQKSLRKELLKYKLHKDQILFERAYSYIKEYY